MVLAACKTLAGDDHDDGHLQHQHHHLHHHHDGWATYTLMLLVQHGHDGAGSVLGVVVISAFVVIGVLWRAAAVVADSVAIVAPSLQP